MLREKQKETIIEWLKQYCYGHKNAKHLRVIITCLNINERVFRSITSELKHDKFVASTTDLGYWWIMDPLIGDSEETRGEIEAVKRSWLDYKSRAMSMLTDCDKALKEWEDKARVATQGQMLLDLKGAQNG